ARRNLHIASWLKTVEGKAGLEISGDIESAVVWSSEVAPDLAAAPDNADRPRPSLPAWVKELVEHTRIGSPSHERLYAQRLGGAGMAYALLQTVHEPLLLSVDPVEARSEALFQLRKASRMSAISDSYVGQLLVEQPLRREWWDHFPAALVAEHETLAVDND